MLYNDSYDRREGMPPIRKIQKEDIVKTSLEILKTESMDSLNARRIAKELNCSVQPIFYNFENMEDLKNAKAIATGLAASPGAGTGKIYFDAKDISEFKRAVVWQG